MHYDLTSVMYELFAIALILCSISFSVVRIACAIEKLNKPK